MSVDAARCESPSVAIATMDVIMSLSEAIQCPVCTYDLSSLPDSKCPECGNSFTRDGIKELREERAQRRGDLIALLTTAPILIILVFIAAKLIGAFLMGPKSAPFFGVLALAVPLAIWTHARREVWKAQPFRLMMPIFPCALLALFLGALHQNWWSTIQCVCYFGVAMSFGIMSTSSSLARSIAIASTLPILARGCAMMIHAVHRSAQGIAWTDFDWSYSRFLSSRDAASISTTDALWLAPLHILAVFAIICIVWTFMPRRPSNR